MTKEKRMECLEWLVDQAELVRRSLVRIEFSKDITIEVIGQKSEVHLYGDGFYELARAASQTVKTERFDDTTDTEFFLFDGVKFFRLRHKEVESDG